MYIYINISIYLSIPTYLSIYLSIYLLVYLFMYFYLCIYLCTYTYYIYISLSAWAPRKCVRARIPVHEACKHDLRSWRSKAALFMRILLSSKFSSARTMHTVSWQQNPTQILCRSSPEKAAHKMQEMFIWLPAHYPLYMPWQSPSEKANVLSLFALDEDVVSAKEVQFFHFCLWKGDHRIVIVHGLFND